MITLVAYASKHGATHEVADRIASVLREQGVHVDVTAVSEVHNVAAYDAVVICSAVYYGRWMKAAADLVRSHADELAARPVWLCSSGPVGPKDLPEAAEIAEFTTTIAPVAHLTFAGALDRSKLSMAERLVVKGVHAPDGDFRDWNLIETWAREIAEQLDMRVPVGGSRHGS